MGSRCTRTRPSRQIPAEITGEYAKDLRQAGLVLADSPKASAAISRRLLQHTIREKAGIKKHNLDEEIQALIDSNTLPADLAHDLDALRTLGNFAAHPIKSTNTGEVVEVEPGEAEWLLELLEELLDFYFVRPTVRQKRQGRAQHQATGRRQARSSRAQRRRSRRPWWARRRRSQRSTAGEADCRRALDRLPHVPAPLRVDALRRRQEHQAGRRVARPRRPGLHPARTDVHLMDERLGDADFLDAAVLVAPVAPRLGFVDGKVWGGRSQRAQALWEPEIAREPEMQAYGMMPERRQEADWVDGCAQRFANAEVAGRDSLGRTGPVKFFQPLGDYLEKELAKAGEMTVARVHDAVLTAVAVGYVGFAMFEVPNPGWRLQEGRTERQVWDFWIPRLNVGFLEKARLPPAQSELLSPVRGTGCSSRI